MIMLAMRNESLPVYGTGLNVRDWLHVRDHCDAIDAILTKGNVGEVYNIGGNCEKRNIDIVKVILDKMGKSEGLIRFVEDRKGHDLRYAIDKSKIKRDLGWTPKIGFEEGMTSTIDWYISNTKWLSRIENGDYLPNTG